MTKRFKAVKASIVTGLVLVSVIVAVLPTASAGLIFNLQSVLQVSWGASEFDEPVVPRGVLRTLTLEISHTVTHGLLGKGLLAGLAGSPVNINIEVIETPTWCTANINIGSVTVTVKPSGESSKINTTLTMQVADDAPAFGLGYVKIKATAQKAGVFISGYDNVFTLNFIPDYKPLISPYLPEANTKEKITDYVNKVIDLFNRPVIINEKEIFIPTSIGIAVKDEIKNDLSRFFETL